MTEKKRILVVDDEDIWRQRIANALDGQDLVVDLTRCRDEAEGMLRSKNLYDLVISDNSMPRTLDSIKLERDSGLGLRAWMRFDRRRLRDVPFILHSADEAGTAERKVEEIGGIFCGKSDDMTLLAGTVNRILA